MKPYRYYWYDDTHKNILIFELMSRWTWDDALEAVHLQGEEMARLPHKVHTVFHFERNVSWVPQGSAFSNLKKLMGMVYPNEDLVIFVGKHLLLEMFIRSVGSVYKFTNQMSRYHFVHSMDDAIALVQKRSTLPKKR